MICENCKKENASLILMAESLNDKAIRKKERIKWTRYLCSECYIFINWGSAEYDKFKESQKR